MLHTISPTTASIEKIKDESNRFQGLVHEVAKVIVGQKDTVNFISIAALCNGHILLEGVPGVAKTTMIKAVTKALGLHFNRIQFTPDLLPADLIGSVIYNPKIMNLKPKRGHICQSYIG